MTSVLALLWEGFKITQCSNSSKLINKHIYALFYEGLDTISLYDLYENCVIETLQLLELNVILSCKYINLKSVIDSNIKLNLYITIKESINLNDFNESIEEVISTLPCVLNISINNNCNKYILDINITFNTNALSELTNKDYLSRFKSRYGCSNCLSDVLTKRSI